VSSSPEPPDRGRIEQWLATQHEARLGYSSGAGPRRLVVRYAVSAGRLVFRLPEYSSALGYASNQEVTMQVPVRDPGRAGVSHLVVRGVAVVVADDSGAGADLGLDERWPETLVTRVLALPTVQVEVVQPR
jgi:hypothetical protein